MKSVLAIIFYLLATCLPMHAQESAVTLSKDQFAGIQRIFIGKMDGWMFKAGADSSGINHPNLDSGWRSLNPSELSPEMADQDGRFEGWFTIKIRLDSNLSTYPLGIKYNGWGAIEFFQDGQLVASLGNTSTPFQEFNPFLKYPISLNFTLGQLHTLSFHIVDFISNFPVKRVRQGNGNSNQRIFIAGPAYTRHIDRFNKYWEYLEGIWASVNGIIALLLAVMAFSNRSERNLRFIAFVAFLFFGLAAINLPRYHPNITFHQHNVIEQSMSVLFPVLIVMSLILISKIFRYRLTLKHHILLGILFLAALLEPILQSGLLDISVAAYTVAVFIYILIQSWKSLRGAQWAVVIGLLLSFVAFVVFGIFSVQASAVTYIHEAAMLTVLFTSFPLSLALYVSMRFTEIIRDVREQAIEVVRISNEKAKLMNMQQELLERKVEERTMELHQSLTNLKSTQSQLIQSEKMASLGELTAGIAHEIQNPLNFVNNFSEVNEELIDELTQELAAGNGQSAEEIAKDIKNNQQKILHHGKRADAIVKGMLQHSRSSSGTKEPTDINALADEYLRLAYHGLRAKDKSFNATMKTNFDESIGNINIIPQDIGRVILNLITNAFYVVNERLRQAQPDSGYEPTVIVSTKKEGNNILISVKDNGNGIPDSIKEKIFQPFFTTKPTGQGTGLGLSLSYDIVKAHGGELKVETKEGEGSNFIITLPNDN
jgi:two-component system, NtrC family, sensor kinase